MVHTRFQRSLIELWAPVQGSRHWTSRTHARDSVPFLAAPQRLQRVVLLVVSSFAQSPIQVVANVRDHEQGATSFHEPKLILLSCRAQKDK